MGTFSISQTRASMDLFLIPNANGCNIDLTPIGDTNNWECVDDPIATPDEDATYVKSSATNLKYDLYILPNHTTEIGTINNVQVFARAKSQTIGQHEDGIFKILVTDDACANIYKSNDMSLMASTYKIYSKVWTENPRTSTAWIWSDIDNLQIGAECSSPSINTPQILTIRPNAAGDITQLTPEGDTPNWKCVDEETKDDMTTFVYHPPLGAELEDLYNLANHTTESGVISKITVFVWVYPYDVNDRRAKTAIKIGGSTHYGSYNYVTKRVWTLISTTYNLNPTTSLAWTWNDIDNLQAGIYLAAPGAAKTFRCTQVYVAVHHIELESPEIRTTQCYAKVNYVPSDATCTLNKPEDISVNHDINVKMLNFWDGSREVYSLNRSGKSMVLTGSEYQSNTCNKECPCERIACMREMGKDGSIITISGLRSLFNGDFRIRSFGWHHISEKPEYYTWILELEYDD